MTKRYGMCVIVFTKPSCTRQLERNHDGNLSHCHSVTGRGTVTGTPVAHGPDRPGPSWQRRIWLFLAEASPASPPATRGGPPWIPAASRLAPTPAERRATVTPRPESADPVGQRPTTGVGEADGSGSARTGASCGRKQRRVARANPGVKPTAARAANVSAFSDFSPAAGQTGFVPPPGGVPA